MKIKQLLGLILLWCIDECSGQGITIVNNCTCKTFDGGIYSLMPLRRTDGKPRYTRLSVQSIFTASASVLPRWFTVIFANFATTSCTWRSGKWIFGLSQDKSRIIFLDVEKNITTSEGGVKKILFYCSSLKELYSDELILCILYLLCISLIYIINWVDNVYFGHRKEFLKLTPRALAFDR